MSFLLIASYADSLINFRGPLIAALQAKGLTVHVAAPDLGKDSPQRTQLQALDLQVHDIPLQRTGLNPIADLKALWSLVQLIRQINPQYMMAYTIKPVVYGLLAGMICRVPHRFALITGLGYAFQDDDSTTAQNSRGWIKKIAQNLYRVALRGAELTLFQNPDDEALFRQLGILSANAQTLVVNGSGVDIRQYDVAPLPTFGIDQPIVFLMIARLLGDKGTREYAEAAKIISARYPQQTRFDLVGWIDDNPNAIAQHELDQWISDGRLRFLGKLKDVRPAIADCAVYVLPSYREGTPRTVLEAMAMGRAVITTDAAGCRETVTHEQNGYLVEVKSVDALVDAMEKLIQDPTLIVSMGQQSRQLAESKYDVNLVNSTMIKAMGIH